MGVSQERDRITASHDTSEASAAGMHGVGVSVPGTSANLGPGYDSFGVAVDVPLVAVTIPRQDRRIVPAGEGAEELPAGDDNVVWQGVLAWCAHTGTTPPDVSITVDSAIPLERGLGSSSAAAVAGLMLGRALTGGVATVQQLLGLATDLEGHPDNAAAAIVGGLVACTPDGEFIRVTPTDSLRPVLLVPVQRQSTKSARAALPELVSLSTAAANIGHATMTFAGLAGLVPLTAAAMVDRLHEPARLPLMPRSQALIEALRAVGIPTALSGAGPTVLAIVPSGDTDVLAQVHDLATATLGGGEVEVIDSRWQMAGATVCPPALTLGPSD